MKTVGRILFIVATLLTLSYLPALQSMAQTDDVDALNKKIVELSQAKKFAEAIPLAERVLAIRERTLARDHPDVATALKTLAQLYRAQGRIAEAAALEKRAQAQQASESAAAPPPSPPRAAQGQPPSDVESAASAQEAARKAQEEAARRPRGGTQSYQSSSRPGDAPTTSPSVGASQPRPPAATASPQSAPQRDAPFVSRSGPTRSGPGAGPPGGSASSGTSAGAQPQTLPDFPWPPPAASASYVLPRTIFASRSTVGQVVDSIVSALERTGYVERSFFRTQANGVALVTRIERINDDGTARAESERWPAALQNYQTSSDLVGFFRGLFYVDRGRYRVIVFVLQDLPFNQAPDRVTGPEARTWLREGANTLPREVANRLFGDGNCSVLIYEFASDGTAVRMVESRLTGKQHLEKAGVLATLEKSN